MHYTNKIKLYTPPPAPPLPPLLAPPSLKKEKDLFLFLVAVSIVTTRQTRMPVAGPLPPWVPLTHCWLVLPPFIWAHALIRRACVFAFFPTFGNEVCIQLPAAWPAWGASQPPRSPNTHSKIWQTWLVTSHTHFMYKSRHAVKNETPKLPLCSYSL